MMLAFEKLLGDMPPPPTTAACSGCSANVSNVTVSLLELLTPSGPLGIPRPLISDDLWHSAKELADSCMTTFWSTKHVHVISRYHSWQAQGYAAPKTQDEQIP